MSWQLSSRKDKFIQFGRYGLNHGRRFEMSKGGYRRGKQHVPVESCHSLSAWGYYQAPQIWQKDDNFEMEWEFGEEFCQLRFLRYGIQRQQRITLTTTTCHFGKERSWFQCPLCTRRVGKLYLPESMYTKGQHVWRFQCRQCYDLTYEQRQHRNQQWTYRHRAERLADRWLGETSKDWIGKKKGQHQTTFEERADQYEDLLKTAGSQMGSALQSFLASIT